MLHVLLCVRCAVTTVRQTNTSRPRTDENAVAEVQVNDVGSKDGQEEASTDGQSSGDDYTPTGESDRQHVRYRPYTRTTDQLQQCSLDCHSLCNIQFLQILQIT